MQFTRLQIHWLLFLVYHTSKGFLNSFTSFLDLSFHRPVFHSLGLKLSKYCVFLVDSEHFSVLDVQECLLPLLVLPRRLFDPSLFDVYDLPHVEYVLYSCLHIPHYFLVTLKLFLVLNLHLLHIWYLYYPLFYLLRGHSIHYHVVQGLWETVRDVVVYGVGLVEGKGSDRQGSLVALLELLLEVETLRTGLVKVLIP